MHPPSAFLLPCPRIPAIVPSTGASCTPFLTAFGRTGPTGPRCGEVGSNLRSQIWAQDQGSRSGLKIGAQHLGPKIWAQDRGSTFGAQDLCEVGLDVEMAQ